MHYDEASEIGYSLVTVYQLLAEAEYGRYMDAKDSTAILAWVSSKIQEDEGYSLDSQLKLLLGYCEKNSLAVCKIFKITETPNDIETPFVLK